MAILRIRCRPVRCYGIQGGSTPPRSPGGDETMTSDCIVLLACIACFIAGMIIGISITHK